jgi:hypothetical protein
MATEANKRNLATREDYQSKQTLETDLLHTKGGTLAVSPIIAASSAESGAATYLASTMVAYEGGEVSRAGAAVPARGSR